MGKKKVKSRRTATSKKYSKRKRVKPQHINVSTRYSKKKAIILTSILLITTIIIVYCVFFHRPTESVKMPNPAAIYCIEKAGKLENRETELGTKGFCMFNDGSECNQWDYFNKNCYPGEVFCKNRCGDGVCQDIVCEAIGCPCSETRLSCPEDC